MGITWKRIRELCKQHNIMFKNQTFVHFISELRNQFMNKQSKRITLNDEIKNNICQKFENKCVNCQVPLKTNLKLTILYH